LKNAITNLLIYIDQNDRSGAHRAGWKFVYDHIKRYSDSNSNLLLDLYVDRTFHWKRDVFKHLGIDSVAIDIRTEDIAENINLINSHKIDCAFIALHGRFGEDGQVQRILEQMNLPYNSNNFKIGNEEQDDGRTDIKCIFGLCMTLVLFQYRAYRAIAKALQNCDSLDCFPPSSRNTGRGAYS
jgi:hypothetical protein